MDLCGLPWRGTWHQHLFWLQNGCSGMWTSEQDKGIAIGLEHNSIALVSEYHLLQRCLENDLALAEKDFRDCFQIIKILSHAGTIGLGVKPLQLKRLHSKNSLRLDGPDTPSQNVSGSYTHRFLHRVRSDLVKAEMNIPWDAVHPSWKKQRMTWKTWGSLILKKIGQWLKNNLPQSMIHGFLIH